MLEQYGNAVEPYLDDMLTMYTESKARVLQRAQAAAATAMAGDKPEGRPDLGNPGRTAEAKEMMDNVDEARNRDGRPDVRSDDTVAAEAERLLSEDYEDQKAAIQGAGLAGQQLSDVQTVIAKRILNDLAKKAAKTGTLADVRAMTEFADSYRETGKFRVQYTNCVFHGNYKTQRRGEGRGVRREKRRNFHHEGYSAA